MQCEVIPNDNPESTTERPANALAMQRSLADIVAELRAKNAGKP